jgi:hypothetical protein
MIISEEVRAGVELLDVRMPGWFRRVNVPDIADSMQCVLGQLFAGGYIHGLNALNINTPAEYGFNAWGDEPDRNEYEALTAQWAYVITERQTAR